MALKESLIDELLKDTKTLAGRLRRFIRRKWTPQAIDQTSGWSWRQPPLLDEELTDHLGYHKHDSAGKNSGNSRNGHTDKTVIADPGKMDLKIPRERDSSFEPFLIPKGQRRLAGFELMLC